jgi:hypothetical protein
LFISSSQLNEKQPWGKPHKKQITLQSINIFDKFLFMVLKLNHFSFLSIFRKTKDGLQDYHAAHACVRVCVCVCVYVYITFYVMNKFDDFHKTQYECYAMGGYSIAINVKFLQNKKQTNKQTKTLWLSVRKQNTPTEWPPFAGKVNANFCR